MPPPPPPPPLFVDIEKKEESTCFSKHELFDLEREQEAAQETKDQTHTAVTASTYHTSTLGGSKEHAKEQKAAKEQSCQAQTVEPTPVPRLQTQEKKVSAEIRKPVELANVAGLESKANRTFSISLMEICKLDVPLVKRVPNSQRSCFALEWARLLNEAVFSKQLGSWAEFFCFPKCVLWTPVRGGKRLAKQASIADIVKTRLRKWKTDKEGLWKEAVARSQAAVRYESEPAPAVAKDAARTEKAVLSALRIGDVRKALQLLNSAPIAPKNEATLKCLRKLHPASDIPTPIPHCETPFFNEDVVRKSLCTFGPGSAAGLFGYKPFLLQQCVRAETHSFTGALTHAVNHFASGQAPPYLRKYIAGGVSIALAKSATAVRPLACGDPIRRLVAKCFCVAGKEEISQAFAGRNFGVGCKGGVEVVAHSLRSTLKQYEDSDMALLKIDFRNAFNEVSRSHFMQATANMFPAMSNWTQWCYGEKTMLLYDHSTVIDSCSGVQQGDPLGPLYFCCGINCLVNEIQALNPMYNKWYMDDGGIVGSVHLLKQVWHILQTHGPALGLHLNPAKCEWSWLNPGCSLPCPIRQEGVPEDLQVKLVPHSQIQMLGVPLGSDSFVSGFVENTLLGNLQETVDRLVEFEDTQSASYLLRVSYSIVRAVHFMRTTPLEQWKEQAGKFDSMIRKAIESILGIPMDDRTFSQACLTPKLGGLGLRRTAEHADLAFHASWHESMRTAKEAWPPPPGMSPQYVPQSEASYEADARVYQSLIDTAPTRREVQRLRRCAQPHANGLITAVPSEEDGRDTLLKPRVFRTAVMSRLGVPLLKEEISCSLCEQHINKYGDHATCCSRGGSLINRHNTIRDLVDKIASDGMLSLIPEKKGILGPTSGRRPGDVTIPRWSEGQGLAIDIAITSPLSSSVNEGKPCEPYAANVKHAKYDKSFVGTEYMFCAMVWETLGALNEEGEEVIKQIFRFAAKRLGREFSSFCGRSWARVSCCLQRSVAQSILTRTDGVEFRDESF